MSNSDKLVLGPDSVVDTIRDSINKGNDKIDTVDVDSGSPNTPLQTQPSGLTSAATTTANSSCSSSSSESVTGGAAQTLRKRKVGFVLPNPSVAQSVKFNGPSAAQSKSADQSYKSSTLYTAPLKSIMRSSAKSSTATAPSASASASAAAQSLKSSPPSTDQSKSEIPSGAKSSKTTTPLAAQSKPSNINHADVSSSKPKTATGHLKLGRGCGTMNTTSCGAKRSGKSTIVPMKPPKIVPAGNLFPSGIVKITGMTQGDQRTKCIGPGMKSYGYGSVIGGMDPPGEKSKSSSPVIPTGPEVDTLLKTAMSSSNAEEVKGIGNQMFNRGCFNEALKLYDRAIELLATNPTFHSIRAVTLLRMGRIGEAVNAWEEAIKLDPKYARAHHRLASLLLRLGQVDNARIHFYAVEEQPDLKDVNMLQLVDKHLKNCTDARSRREWKVVLSEAVAAMASGADISPQLAMCKVEALLKLQRLDDARKVTSFVYKVEPFPESFSEIRFFDMLSEAYTSFVKSQIDLALGRFENAVTAAEKASDIDPGCSEIETWYRNVKLIASARDRGNDLCDSERYTEGSTAYTEALRLDPSNATLLFHRADSFFKVGKWESSIVDCNQALFILPSNTAARFQRAASYSKLERWAEAVSDYEILRKEMPYDKEIAELLFHSQVALKKSNGEVVLNMEFGGEVEEISRSEELKAALTRPGVSIVQFFKATDYQCKQMCEFMDALCIGYPFMNFFKVDIEKCSEVGDAEKVRVVPTFKIYKLGARIKEIVCPSKEVLEKTVMHYNL